jgi:hypothetical protein
MIVKSASNRQRDHQGEEPRDDNSRNDRSENSEEKNNDKEGNDKKGPIRTERIRSRKAAGLSLLRSPCSCSLSLQASVTGS